MQGTERTPQGMTSRMGVVCPVFPVTLSLGLPLWWRQCCRGSQAPRGQASLAVWITPLVLPLLPLCLLLQRHQRQRSACRSLKGRSGGSGQPDGAAAAGSALCAGGAQLRAAACSLLMAVLS